jgi:hypothetical protein
MWELCKLQRKLWNILGNVFHRELTVKILLIENVENTVCTCNHYANRGCYDFDGEDLGTL